MKNYSIRPSVEQLEVLASIGASRPRRMQSSSALDDFQPKYHAVDMLDMIVVSEEGSGLERARHSIGVRMGRRAIDVVNEVCRLEYVEAYRVEREMYQQIKAVTKYEFEWNDETVLLARRTTTFSTYQERSHVKDIGDAVLNFYLPDDAASVLDAEVAYGQVSYEDCEQFIESTAAYYRQVNLVNR